MIRIKDVELIKSQVNMRMLAEHLGFKVDRKGQILCPFHQDKRPSMRVYEGHTDHDGYYCWACGAAGDIFKFVREYCGLGFEEAVRYIAKEFGITIEDGELSEVDLSLIQQRKMDRRLDNNIMSAAKTSLYILSENIRLYELLQEHLAPFSDGWCWLSNKITTLNIQWEQLFEFTYSKKGVRG